MEYRVISVCIPTFNRFELLVEALKDILEDSRVREIVIVDDCSTDNSFIRLQDYYKSVEKVKLYQNNTNLDCYRNKRESMGKATEDWCILFDSDNILTKSYLDTIFAIKEWEKEIIYQPSFAKPHFDFRNYEGLTLNANNTKQFTDTILMTALNAMNFFIHRKSYIEIWDGSVDPVTSDSIYFNYCWLSVGNKIFITPGLEYEHRIHSGSHYQNNNHRTGNFHQGVLNKLQQL